MTRRAGAHLARLAETSLERCGDHPAILFEGRWHRAQDLHERSTRLAGGLLALGLRPGDRVAVTMVNCPEVRVVYLALWRAGLVVVPITFLLPAADLRHALADSGARAVIASPEQLPKLGEATPGLSELAHVVGTGGVEGSGPRLAELERAAPAPILDRDEDDLAAVLYTGGTTGRAKGVMLSHGNLAYTGGAAYASSHEPGVSRSLVTLPLAHAYGLLVTVSGLHAREPSSAALLRWFEPRAFLDLVQDQALQQTSLVPTMIARLLDCPLEEYELGSLRSISCGAAPLPAELERAFAERLPGTRLRQGYGMTETAALISSSPAGHERAGSAGRPIPGTEVEIRDEAGERMAPGEVGEIRVRSPGVMRGYWRAPEATARVLRDGWLRTGDLGYLDAGGSLFVVDRRKDLIIRGGFNVYPRDVEDGLLVHPDVTMAGVVGIPSERHGEEVVAFVALRAGAEVTPSELVAWSRAQLGGYRSPRVVHVLDAVPLTPVGKIDRRALRARATATPPG